MAKSAPHIEKRSPQQPGQESEQIKTVRQGAAAMKLEDDDDTDTRPPKSKGKQPKTTRQDSAAAPGLEDKFSNGQFDMIDPGTREAVLELFINFFHKHKEKLLYHLIGMLHYLEAEQSMNSLPMRVCNFCGEKDFAARWPQHLSKCIKLQEEKTGAGGICPESNVPWLRDFDEIPQPVVPEVLLPDMPNVYEVRLVHKCCKYLRQYGLCDALVLGLIERGAYFTPIRSDWFICGLCFNFASTTHFMTHKAVCTARKERNVTDWVARRTWGW